MTPQQILMRSDQVFGLYLYVSGDLGAKGVNPIIWDSGSLTHRQNGVWISVGVVRGISWSQLPFNYFQAIAASSSTPRSVGSGVADNQ